MALQRKTVLGLLAMALCAMVCQASTQHLGKLGRAMERFGTHVVNPLTTQQRAQQLTQVRHLSQALLSIHRHFLQMDSPCEWDTSAGTCSLTPAAILGFLPLPSEDASNSLFGALNCHIIIAMTGCESRKGCTWNQGLCSASTDSMENGLEKCVGSMAALIRLENFDITCNELKKKMQCNKAESCLWSGDELGCGADLWKILIGVPSEGAVPQGFTKVTKEVSSQVTDQVSKLLESGSSPDDLLNLTSDAISCPEDVNPIICQIIDPLFAELKIIAFCSAMYSGDDDGCESDSRCSVDEGVCTLSKTVFEDAFVEQIKAPIQDSKIADVVGRLARCGIIESESACISPCAWDADTGCGLNDKEYFARLAAAASDNDGLDCQLTGAALGSGCFEPKNESDCISKVSTDGTLCVWHPTNGCGTSNDFNINFLFKSDSNLAKQVLDAEGACKGASDETACSEAML